MQFLKNMIKHKKTKNWNEIILIGLKYRGCRFSTKYTIAFKTQKVLEWKTLHAGKREETTKPFLTEAN